MPLQARRSGLARAASVDTAERLATATTLTTNTVGTHGGAESELELMVLQKKRVTNVLDENDMPSTRKGRAT